VFDFSRGSEERAMYAVEFQAKIKNGTIEIPEVYRKGFKERVRVILLAEEESATVNLIDQLLQHPLKVAGFKPLSREEITVHGLRDPVLSSGMPLGESDPRLE
jgi:hypothetical protein